MTELLQQELAGDSAIEVREGVSLALKLLTLLYIGGASSSKERLPEKSAFRTALPDIKCQEAFPLADGIALACVVCYGLLIPSFLAYLMFKQHVALAPSRHFVSHVAKKERDVTVWVWPLEELEKSEPEQDKELKRKSLLAAAVARSCIYFSGGARVQLQDERLILRPHEKGGQEHDASSFVWRALGSKYDADLRRCQALERMLKERYLLEEAATSDRIVAGAKELFVKYAACQNVWFEIDRGRRFGGRRLERERPGVHLGLHLVRLACHRHHPTLPAAPGQRLAELLLLLSGNGGLRLLDRPGADGPRCTASALCDGGCAGTEARRPGSAGAAPLPGRRGSVAGASAGRDRGALAAEHQLALKRLAVN
eukprot:s201_g13.t1